MLPERPRRWIMSLGLTVALLLPLVWLFTRTLGLPTYLTFTRLPVTPVGVIVALTELTLSAALSARWRS
jgi:hypothetical protein